MHYESPYIRLIESKFMDNQMGISLQTASTLESHQIYVRDIVVYGETDAKDCPEPSNSASCYCEDKFGLMLFGNNVEGKSIHPEFDSNELPIYDIQSESAWYGDIQIRDSEFREFTSTDTDCGASQAVFARNPSASDYIAIHDFVNTVFYNVNADAIASIDPPNAEWSRVDECGSQALMCTAPQNILLRFDNA